MNKSLLHLPNLSLRLRRWIGWLGVGILTLGPGQAQTLPSASFAKGLPDQTQEGYARLHWPALTADQLAEGWRYELQQDTAADFAQARTLYQGTDAATFLAGLPNGTYYHRLRLVQPEAEQVGPWSAPHTLRVIHHPVRLAFWLAGLGGLVFTLTLLLVLVGAYRSRHETALPHPAT